MTISSNLRRAGPYSGNGSATAFPFDFKVFAKADVRVTLTDEQGLESTLVLNSDYTVTLSSDQDSQPGGTVSYPVSGPPMPAGRKLTLSGSLPYSQPADIQNMGGFYPQVIEDALDRLVVQTQQLNEQLSRTVKVNISDPTPPDQLFAAVLSQASGYASAAAGSAAASSGFADDSAGYANLARDWATKLGAPVDGSEFSAKHYAQLAAQGMGLPVFPSTGIPTTDVGPIFVLGQGPMGWDSVDARYVVTNGEHGQCRFVYVSPTECRLMPRNGDGLIINGRQYRIDPAGIPLAPGGVTTGQTHYVYAKDNGTGGIALEGLLASANPHSRHTDGVEIKTGDPTRTLVGMFWLDGSGHFLSSPVFDFVASWFNRTERMVTNTVSGSTSSTSDTALTGNIGLLTWGSTLLDGEYLGRVGNTAVAFSSANIHVGGVLAAGISVISRTASDPMLIISKNRNRTLSDGPVYADVWGAVSAGTGSYTGTYWLTAEA